MDRRVSSAKGRMRGMKDKVMGSAQDTGHSAQHMASNATSSVQDMASSAAGAVQQAPGTITRQAQGNPLAAGLIAFGVGWLVSSLMPVSEKEKELAQQAESMVREHKDALLEPAKQAGQEMAEQLKPAAQDAVAEVRSTAQDAASTVKGEGQSAVQDVQDQAQQSRETVQSHATS
jgi:gas vesicle protein